MTNNFIENIQLFYSDLPIEDCYFNEIGQNNDVLIVNKSLVFRFPKYKNGIVQLRRETEILNYIKGIVSTPIPNPIYQSFEELEPGKVFTGYNLIDGVPLWKESLTGVKSVELVKGLAKQLVSFLVELHSISEEKASRDLKLEVCNPREEMGNLYDKIQNKLFPFIRKNAQKEISHSFETFLKGERFSNLEMTLIHGDFGASNILWNPETSMVSGIIDFGGSGLGDPAYDFAGILSSYGEDFFDMCINLYPNGNEISERVQFYKSTFALQEALHGIEHDDRQAFESGIKDYR
ncbi:aminoglycoside phosphotransferase family protein [Paenibacillus sp. ACRRX]|uniref:phosphotransferase family protein n=1 Tax=unclassified Paenibacillus TaxID=185978 RepID=UPI001EF492F5|nr:MULTISPECIES: aminoglycoside phosphotransferase family protein [unclassified Paenibacillus]MCG7406660.1 aminoglycoside phosphotransferase family protein [Paenibacillus sp. ACRRX]MDK8179678.1 aminoglycoside phosphotransferase family protein [Paenibacillus sp. UMB4589-SE434]